MIAAGLPLAIATDYNPGSIWKHEFCCGNSSQIKMTLRKPSMPP
jgi:hypothetical protein